MYNWSVDTKRLKKDKEKYEIWKLEQMINYGLNNKKLSKKNLKKYIDIISIDPSKKRFLKMII
jgi:hypothetical protein